MSTRFLGPLTPEPAKPCPSCEGQGKGCHDCYEEGTYGAYAAEQVHRLAGLLFERGLINKRTVENYGWEVQE